MGVDEAQSRNAVKSKIEGGLHLPRVWGLARATVFEIKNQSIMKAGHYLKQLRKQNPANLFSN